MNKSTGFGHEDLLDSKNGIQAMRNGFKLYQTLLYNLETHMIFFDLSKAMTEFQCKKRVSLTNLVDIQ